jgi:hypothetical protein
MSLNAVTNADKLIRRIEDYIKQSSIDASIYLRSKNLQLPLTDDVDIDLSPDVCEKIYIELIRDSMKHRQSMVHQWGLFTHIMPIKQGKDFIFSIKLGVVFPANSK